MARGIVLSFRISAVIILGLLMLTLGRILNLESFDLWNILDFLGVIRDLLSYLAYLACIGILSGLVSLFSAAFGMVDGGFIYAVGFTFAYKIVGRWFYLPPFTDEGIIPVMGQATGQLWLLVQELWGLIISVIFNIAMIFLIYYIIRWIFTADAKFGINIIASLNIIIFIPVMAISIQNFILFIANVLSANLGMSMGGFMESKFMQTLQQIIDMNLLTPAFFVTFRQGAELNFIEFIMSPLFFIAAMSFIFLEINFQMAYVDQVTKPSIEREERLTAQIQLLRIEAERAVGNIKAIEENNRKEKELKLQMVAEGKGGKEKKVGMGDELKSYMSDSGKAQFSYISELIERKRLEREQKAMLDAMKDTRRLAYYLDKLFKQEPQAFQNLTAKTSAPSSRGLIRSTILNLFFRIGIITVLTWLCMHPQFAFQVLFQAPPAIANSVELQTPEAVLSIFLPLIMLIPLASLIIRVTKHNKLRELLRMEEIKRSGLSEEEFAELERRRSQVAQEEVQIQEDADAAAAQKQPATT
jgi:hypothetical protein